MAGNEVLSADDVLIWPEPHEGMWRLLVYIEDFKGTEERARIECFQAVRALIDRTVGEAARLRRADAITLVPKALRAKASRSPNSGNSSSRRRPNAGA